MSFVSLNASDFVVSADSITSTLWTGQTPTLEQFFTSSATSSFNTYLDVYQTGSLRSDAEVQFAIAYGEAEGSGSAPYNNLVTGSSPSRVTYGHFRTLVNGDENTNFNFGTGKGSSVLEVIKAFEKNLKISIPYQFAKKRDGDAAISYCSNKKAIKELNWKNKYSLNDAMFNIKKIL